MNLLTGGRRAGPSTLVRAGDQTFLVDCGRGVLMRTAALGIGANAISALLLTHLHSDHIADLGDVLISRWVSNFAPNQPPLPIIGPPGTAEVVENTLKAFGPDIGYRIAHHADLTAPPPVEVASTVCAGDTLLAAMLHGQLAGLPAEDALRLASGLSAEAVRHVGVGRADAPDFSDLQAQVCLETTPHGAVATAREPSP